MPLLNDFSLLELMKCPPPSRASRKGARFFALGKPITSCPYSNAKRRQQFEWAWQEAESYQAWSVTLSGELD